MQNVHIPPAIEIGKKKPQRNELILLDTKLGRFIMISLCFIYGFLVRAIPIDALHEQISNTQKFLLSRLPTTSAI